MKAPPPIRFDFAGAERVYGSPNSGEAAVVGGDDHFDFLLRRGTACPELAKLIPKYIRLGSSSPPDAASIFLV